MGTLGSAWPAPSALGDCHPPACPGYSGIVSPKNPACSQGQPMGCVPLIPVPMHPATHCLGDSSSSVPTQGDWHMSAARWGRMVAMVSKEKGQLSLE